jgi:hypothetical protein
MARETPKILYICADCYEGDNETCGYVDRRDLAVTPDGRWLCNECLDESNYTDEECAKFLAPPEYVPKV